MVDLVEKREVDIGSLKNQEWYQNLIDDCKTIITERKFNAAWEIISCKWEIGDRILQDCGNFERAKIYGKEIVRQVAESLESSPREVWYCIQFRKKYPNLTELPEGKAITWHKIQHEYLPETKEESLLKPKIELYNIWNFAKRDSHYTEPIFGSQTAELIFNLLYYYTNENDLVFDVFAGSGLVNNVCQKMNRRCYSTDLTPQRGFIKEMNVIKELPDIEPDLIFLDPPYWNQAKGEYSNSPDDLANMLLDKFYNSFDILFSNLGQTYNGFTLALLIANSQWRNNRKVEPHAFKLFEKLSSHFSFEHHIIVPYSTQQYNGSQVEIAKKEKLILTLHRDLLIFKNE